MSLYYNVYRPNYANDVTTEIILKQIITAAGLNPTYEAADPDGNLVRPGPGTFLHVKNGSGGEILVSIADPNTPIPDGVGDFFPTAEIVIPDGEERFIDLQDASRFSRAVDGMADVQYTDTFQVNVGAFQL